MDWCNVYLTPQGLPKYIYLSPPLIFPTTYNGIRTKNRPVWFTPALLPYVEWDRFVTLAGSIHDVVWCLVNHQKKSSNKHLHFCNFNSIGFYTGWFVQVTKSKCSFDQTQGHPLNLWTKDALFLFRQ